MTSSLPPYPTPRVEFELCTSSVSSAELSSPTIRRPDSPRLLLNDLKQVAQARLHQLAVWGDAAEEERETDETSIIDELQPTDSSDRIGDRVRLADRKKPSTYGQRRQSVFCSRRPSSVQLGITRKPSLWDLSTPDRPSQITNYQHRSSFQKRPSMSMRRGKSFHRFSRISGDQQQKQHKHSHSFSSYVRNFASRSSSHTDFDDLTEGLGAKKVVERPIVGQS